MTRHPGGPALVVFAYFFWAASAAHAQGIGGTVTDATGAVLPGIAVEARSPVLIEQVRTAVTDGAGEYLITELLSGVYSVTFRLAGFSLVVREGVQLSAGFTAPIDAELAVGSLAETIMVTAASPVVDVRSVSQQRSLNREVLDNIPSGKSLQSLATLVPGMVAGDAAGGLQGIDVGGQAGFSAGRLSIHGSDGSDQQIEIDGLAVNSPRDGLLSTFVADGNYTEYALNYSANTAEFQTGGVRVNVIPRDGGNTFAGRLFANVATQGLQASNIDEELIDRGLSPDSQNRLSELWSLNPSFGGPIASDKLWFHVSHTTSVSDRFLAGLFPDNDPNDLNYTPTSLDPGSQTVTEGPRRSTALRLTWQAAPRHKVTAFWDHNRLEGTNGAAVGGPVTDEAAFDTEGPNSTYQIS